ncbi:MAG: hypothetical protein KDC35_06010 [Acidobacteria bacterium]|nr:hypothetical protein [Acidobacteriota bacterium]
MHIALFWLLAQITLQPEPRAVLTSGNQQQLGSWTFTLHGNALYEVDQSHIIHLELRLPESLVLSQTLVDFEYAASNSEPIYLPLLLEGDQPGRMAAPANSLRIARWRRGEQSIWLQVLASSSYWVESEGVNRPPSAEFPVSFTLGGSSERSRDRYQSAFDRGRASLPYTQRDGTPQHVFLLVDVKEPLQPGERLTLKVHATTNNDGCNIRNESTGYWCSFATSSALFDGSGTLGFAVDSHPSYWMFRSHAQQSSLEIINLGRDTTPLLLQWLGENGLPFMETVEAPPGRTSISQPMDRSLLLIDGGPDELRIFMRTTNEPGQSFDFDAASYGHLHRFLLPSHDLELQLYNAQLDVLNVAGFMDGQILDIALEPRELRRVPLTANTPGSLLVIESNEPFVCQLIAVESDADTFHWQYTVPTLD